MSALTLASVSPRAAELLHTLYAETLAAAEASLPVPPTDTVVLAPHGALCHHHGDSSHTFAYFDNYDTSIRLSRYHDDRTSGWTGYEKRMDASGRTWERRVNAVIDNFGDLVEVPA